MDKGMTNRTNDERMDRGMTDRMTDRADSGEALFRNFFPLHYIIIMARKSVVEFYDMDTG